jgi:hypothetical protein
MLDEDEKAKLDCFLEVCYKEEENQTKQEVVRQKMCMQPHRADL